MTTSETITVFKGRLFWLANGGHMLISDIDKLGVCNQLPHLGELGKEAEQTAF